MPLNRFKICWDSLNKAKYIYKFDIFTIDKYKYFIKYSCKECNEPFLCYLGKKHTVYCSEECRAKTRGIHMKEEKYKKLNGETEKRKKISNSLRGKYTGESRHWNWVGGVKKLGTLSYELVIKKVGFAEEIRRNTENKYLPEVKCTYCGKWFIPTSIEIRDRHRALLGKTTQGNESRFYCSTECKKLCPIFGMSAKSLMKQDAIKAGRLSLKDYKNEVPRWIKEHVLKLDNYTCQICGSKDKLHVHHEIPRKKNQMLTADIDNCLTFCQKCHKWVHTQIDGCGYQELASLEIC